MKAKSFYGFSIVFAGFLILVGFLVSAWLLILGYRAYELAFIGVLWYGLYFTGWLTWYIILAVYYSSEKYWAAFYAIILLLAASLFAGMILTNQTNEITPSQYHISLIINTLIVVHGIILITSRTSEKKLLKTLGIFYTGFGIMMTGLTIWFFNSLTALVDGYALRASQFSPLFENITLILFIIHFLNEREISTSANPGTRKGFGNVMAGIVSVVLIILIGMAFMTEKDIARIKNHTEPASRNEKNLAERFEAGLFSSGKKKLPYRFLKPMDYDSTKSYPLVVCLHGSSGRGVGNVIQVSRSLMATNLSKPENRRKFQAFLFVPQCAPDAEWGGPGHLPEYNPLVIKAIDSLEKKLPVDPKRLYLTGYSMGGYGVWDLLAKYPDKFAAAVPMCGAGDPDLAPNMVGIPIWAFHGANDRNVRVRGSRNVIEAIKEAGGDPLYTEYKDKRHNIRDNISREPDLLPWLFSQVRER